MAEKILIVDDDPLVSDLTTFLLKDAGYETELVQDSLKALAAIKSARPALVILDILMPGIDGLTLCQQIKSDPSLKDIKVAILTSKSFQADKDRAIKLGADAFIEKPFNVNTFAQRIREILGTADIRQPAAASETLKIKFWGCRGAMASPIAVSRYGRRTSCVSIEFKDRLLAFDAGSGLLDLGTQILKEGKHNKTWLFLTHFHTDHFEGLGSFACARATGQTLYITGPNGSDQSLADAVNSAFSDSLSTQPIAAEIQLYQVNEGGYEIMAGMKLTSFYVNHPTTTLGYRLKVQGKTLVYCPVGEIYGDAATAQQDYDQKLGALCQGADMIIHDANFTEADYEANKGQGHSSVSNVVHFAARHDIKRLALFHYNGRYSDETVDQMLAQAQEIILKNGYALQCAAAVEGSTLVI